jgi:hypothetical protein
MRLLRLLALLSACAVLSTVPRALGQADSTAQGTPEVSTVLHATPFAAYRRVYHALTTVGYDLQAGLIDQGVLITMPKPMADSAHRGQWMQIGAQLAPGGDSVRVSVAGRMVSENGEPLPDQSKSMGLLLMEVMKVAGEIGGVGQGGDTVSAPAATERHGYGYDSTAVVKVGGGTGGGHDAEVAYLSSLRGPRGEAVESVRLGSCCTFTRAGDPPQGRIDVWEVTYPGLPAPVLLYLNMYELQAPHAPEGFTQP